MAFLSDQDRERVRQRLEQALLREVTLELFTAPSGLLIPGRECPTCEDTRHLLEELTGLSPRLRLEVYDFYAQPEEAQRRGVERIPAIVFRQDGHTNLKFYGIPAGFEFVTLLETVEALGRGEPRLQERTRRALERLDREVLVQVFVTPG